MKKSYIVFILLILITSIFAEQIIHEYYFSEPSLETNGDWTILTIDGCQNSGKVGEPTLPYRAVNLLLPVGHIATDISIVFNQESTISGSYSVYPMQPSSPISIGVVNQFRVNNDIYQNKGEYPTTAYRGLNTQFKNGHPIALTTFTPVNYNPSSGHISYYKSAKVIIQTELDSKAEKARKFLRNDADTIKQVKSIVDNPEILIDKQSANRYETYEVMLITNEQFANSFEQLTDFYLTRGMRTEIYTREQIATDYTGSDIQEKMRNAIIEEYLNSGINYVVLAGDTEVVPYRGFFCYVESGDGYDSNNIPADLYFSALDGSWNDNNDLNWGEPGEDDLLPEISVGRLTFSTEAQLENIIHKTISYQDNPVIGELETPLLVGENLWDDPMTWGGDYLDLLIGDHDDNGYETVGIPIENNFTTLYDRDLGYWNVNILLEEINAGHSFIHHSGHSNADYNMRMNNYEITNDNFSSVDGIVHNYTLVYTHGCICGAFDVDDCIAENMLQIDNFMVAGVFNSRYGWFNEGQTEGPSQHLHREFIDAIYGDDVVKIGSAHLSSKIDSAPWVTADGQHEFGALRWCFYDANVIGDPTLSIWTSEPITAELDYTQNVAIDVTSLDFSVDTDDTSVDEFVITILENGQFITKGITDENNNATLVFDNSFDEPTALDIYLSATNFITKHYTINVGELSSDNDLTLQTRLNEAYPNPFNPTTTISFDLKTDSKVSLDIYNVRGQKVKTLINDKIESGSLSIIWNGTDKNNNRVSSGIYFYSMKSEGFNSTKKLLMLK